MAFHVACPLTCRKLCNCTLGSSGQLRKLGGKEIFLRSAITLQKLLGKSPLMITTGEDSVEVLAPRLSKESSKKKKKKPSSAAAAVEAEIDDGEEEIAEEAEVDAEAEAEEIAATPPRAPAEAEEQIESPEPKRLEDEFENVAEEEPSVRADEELPPDELPEASSPAQVEEEEPAGPPEEIECGFCSQVEISGSKKHTTMLSCEGCQRVFHRKCIKSWAEHRDLFNWASWRCPYCRTCEDCKAAGDPTKNKLMFCKRCDEPHHANCKQTGVKASTLGPFLCSRHAQCHSCGARVPGGGSSSRWSHSYLFCDACGRLFSKNRYCPICLKVYRETEPAPMVQCDVCQHWLHCVCEGISEEKYQEFQANSDLKFTCAACRKVCFKANSLEDAIGELWRRKDEADREEIKKTRASAGFPSESEMAEFYPSSSEDEQPVVKEPAKKEGKLVIKLAKKPAPEQKPASTPRGSKSKGVKAREEAPENAGHEVEEVVSKSRRSSKKKKQCGDEAKGRDDKAGASGTKITLRVPRKQAEVKEPAPAAPSEDTKEEEMIEQQQSDDETLQSENRRKRLPSAKYRDIDTPASKRSRLNEDADVSKKKAAASKPAETPEPEAEKRPLKLKFRKQEVEAPAPRGQRSKRKRPSASHEDDPPAEEEPAESDEDDSSILQRLGVDAVTKRVEVRRSDKSWLKGTISSVNQRRSQFTVQFDNGDKKTQKYGKDKIRLLGKK